MRFTLRGDLDRLRIPARGLPRRRDGLWRHTCFEVFVASRLPRYREYNFAPSGEWAGYVFSSYRTGLGLARSRPRVRLFRNGLQAKVEAGARIGVAAVIEEKTGALSYWALRHPPGKPDFHHRRVFALRLA